MTMSSRTDSSRADNRTLTYGEAVFEATRSEMARDPSVFVMGQGVDDARGMFGTTLGLHKEFGPERSFDVPLAEDAMTGVGIGAALMGMRPIQVHQRMDFVLLCMNQIVNMASKMSYMFSGAHKVPLVIRAIIGRSWGQGAQHSQAFHSYFMHIPGLRVVAPTTPHDAKGCLIQAIRDDNPVIMIEHRMLHNVKGVVPPESYEIPYGKARVLSPGKDITIVGISHMALECVRAKHLLEDAGIDAEVIDPVSLSPLDISTIAALGRADRPAAGGRHRLAELRRLVGDPVRDLRADRRTTPFCCQAAGLPADPVPDHQDPGKPVLSLAAVDRARPPIGWCAARTRRPGSRARSTAREVAEFRGPF